jgi:CRISPR-associated protein (TIGR03986 family)
MNLPKQPLNIDPDRQALAPYNFVELPERIAIVIEGGKLAPVPEEKKGMSQQERVAWQKAKDKALKERTEKVSEQLPDQNVFHSERHSGWIDCLLTTTSPVYVRAPRTREEANKQIESKDLPAFFYEWDKNEPVIPGSSLRGMLRSLVEIVSYSKITDVSNKRLIYRAVGDTTKHGEKYREQLMRLESGRQSGSEKYYTPLMLGGYMRQKGSDWYIQPAEERDGTTFARIRIDDELFDKLARVPGCHNAWKIFVQIGPYEFQPVRGGFLRVRAARVLKASATPRQGLSEGTLLARSGPMFSKRTEAVIYPPDTKAAWLPLTDDQIDDYRNQVTPIQEEILGKDGVLRDGQPVFYTLKPGGKEVSFFGHCRMLRLPYSQSPYDFVPPILRREDDIDMAEAIFGFTKRLSADKHCDKERHYSGRVRISSARLVKEPNQEGIWLSPGRPVTPKPTTFQHYLVQTQPNQIKVGQTRDRRSKFEVRLADYAAMTPASTVIRGNKLYWHKGDATQADIELVKSDPREKSKDNVTTRIQPLRAGVEFSFRIQFENLSSAELGALFWALRIGADDRYRLKLGMGKPIGMGAVKVIPTLRLIDRSARYSNLFDGDGWNIGLKPDEQAERIEAEAIESFEQFVIGKVGDAKTQRLADLERIKQLLVMLQWPGPDRLLTRYLEIQRKEYVSRPVLPHPLSIANLQEPATKPAMDKPQSAAPQSEEAIPEGYKRGFVVQWGLGPKASSGFIKPVDGKEGEKVFVHLFEVKDHQPLKEFDEVAYTIRNTESGPEATDVRLIHRREGENS